MRSRWKIVNTILASCKPLHYVHSCLPQLFPQRFFKKQLFTRKKTKSLQCGWRDCCNAYTLGKLTISESTENHRISITFQRDSRAAAFITQCKWTQKSCKFDYNSLSNCKERVNPIMEFFSYRRNCRTKRRGKRRVQKKHHNTHTHVPEEKEISRSSQGPPNPNLKPCKCEIGNCKKTEFKYLRIWMEMIDFLMETKILAHSFRLLWFESFSRYLICARLPNLMISLCNLLVLVEQASHSENSRFWGKLQEGN